MGNGPRGDLHNEENTTRHEAEPASSGRSLPRPSMRWTQKWIQTMMPILVSGMNAIGCGEQPLPRVAFWQIVAQKRQYGQKLMVCFLPVDFFMLRLLFISLT